MRELLLLLGVMWDDVLKNLPLDPSFFNRMRFAEWRADCHCASQGRASSEWRAD
jgi:hypothetical protein